MKIFNKPREAAEKQNKGRKRTTNEGAEVSAYQCCRTSTVPSVALVDSCLPHTRVSTAKTSCSVSTCLTSNPFYFRSHRIHKEPGQRRKRYSKQTCPRSAQGRTKGEVMGAVTSITGQHAVCPQGETCKRAGVKGKRGEAGLLFRMVRSEDDPSHLL